MREKWTKDLNRNPELPHIKMAKPSLATSKMQIYNHSESLLLINQTGWRLQDWHEVQGKSSYTTSGSVN